MIIWDNEFIITVPEDVLVLNCFFDVQKYFDSINHDILIKKLSLYGIQGTELAWFKNYLKDHQQFVSLNGEISSPQMIKTGVPQGSALGPFYFLSSLTIYHSILRMRIAIYLQTTVLYIQWVNQQMKPVGLCKNLFSRQGRGSIITTFLLTSLKLYVC